MVAQKCVTTTGFFSAVPSTKPAKGAAVAAPAPVPEPEPEPLAIEVVPFEAVLAQRALGNRRVTVTRAQFAAMQAAVSPTEAITLRTLYRNGDITVEDR